MTSLTLLSAIILFHAFLTSSARPQQQMSEAISHWRSMKNDSGPTGADSCRTGNPIDDCWKCDPNWESNRRMLADCAVGFGRNAIGGRDGEIYTVTDSENDDPMNPSPGTLRHAVIQDEPLWIIFDRNMVIKLKDELIMNSYKTIDGRGVNVAISSGPCITIQNVTNIIIHGLYIHDCVPAPGNATVIDGPNHYRLRGASDGDGISIFTGRDIWIDHCTLTNCRDGLIDVVYESTAITISNSYMFDHNEVMLLGHHDDFVADKIMQVTIAFNYFGEGLVQRIPRHGYFHIVNNVYTGWKMYAVGGSANPTINSQGNLFIASDDNYAKEVTKRDNTNGYLEWKDWNWRSEGDVMQNGAYFRTSGQQTPQSYAKASSLVARPASEITKIITTAGVLDCIIGQQC